MERGCPHTSRRKGKKLCATCGTELCRDCSRPTLLPPYVVCKYGCPTKRSRIEANAEELRELRDALILGKLTKSEREGAVDTLTRALDVFDTLELDDAVG